MRVKKFVLMLIGVFSLLITNAQVTTVSEGFESWPPSSWTLYTQGAGNGWIQSFDGTYHTGSYSAHPNINNNPVDNWMVSPQVSISSSAYELKFWEKNDDTLYYDKVSVWVSTTNGNPTSGNFTQVFTTPDTTTTWKQRTISLSSYVGQNIYVAFRYEGYWHKWYVDDVSIAPSTFVDGALTNVINPTGTSQTPSVENIIVTLENNGTSVINTVDVNWKINGVPQTTFTSTNLNLSSGGSTNLTLGSYNFSTSGDYDIEAILSVTGDIDGTNDTLNAYYSISTPKDGAMIGILPEGMYPFTGVQDVYVLLENKGLNTIDTANVVWSVDGVSQTPFSTTTLNLAAGETVVTHIGQYNFSTAVYEITATLNTPGDTNSLNNSYFAYAAVDTIWESFEGRVFPPENWSTQFGIVDGINFDIPKHGDYYYVSSSDNNYFGVVSDTIFTPLLDITTGDELRFFIKINPFLTANHDVIWKDGTTGAIHLLQTLTPNSGGWDEMVINLSAAAGANYIGITTSSSSYGESKFDMFSSTAKLHINSNDLAIDNGEIYFLAKENVNEKFVCRIKNAGSLPIIGTDYTVKLMQEPGIQLASVNGVNLNPWGVADITFNHTFTAINSHKLYFEIDYSSDNNLSNNTSRSSNVHVVPNTIVINGVGQPGIAGSNFPFNSNGNTNSLGEDDISQSIYSNTDIPVSGDIHGLIYTYNNILASNEVKELPLKVWIAQTDTANLNNGWFPYADLVLVYDDTVDILPGFNREFYIPFNTPQTYTGIDNIVIQHYQYNPDWPPAILRIVEADMPSGTIRTISAPDVFNLDPTNPVVGNLFEDLPFTKFVIAPTIDYCSVNGTVYDAATALPLGGATVAIGGTSIAVSTDANGAYTLPNIPYGSYNIITDLIGYNDTTIAVTLGVDTFTQDIYLSQRVQVSITATVTGDNAPTTPLEGVTVNAVGYTTDNGTTDINGDFTLNNIFGISDYEITLSLYGYFDTTITVSVVDANINLGTIVLEQEFISPFDVHVAAGMTTDIHWKNPLKSSKVKLQNDLGGISTSYTNEPLEHVWLGNIFTITDTTTITDIEIVTDIYPNAIDYVSIDIFDASGELLASSEPFLIYKDSVHIIDVPNIVVYDDIYAMIHWENNAASTNALLLDYTDTTIANTAVIKYPNTPIEFLQDYFGGAGSGVPKMSFHVRVHTLDNGNPTTNNEQLTYNVYRGLASEFPDITNWTKLNTQPVSGFVFTDTGSNPADTTKTYRYAIETIYNGGTSEVTFSNEIEGIYVGVFQIETVGIVTINIAPVPAKDFVTIDIQSEKEVAKIINIYNSAGQLVDTIDMGTGKTITKDVSTYSSGLYILQFNINGETVSKKILINH